MNSKFYKRGGDLSWLNNSERNVTKEQNTKERKNSSINSWPYWKVAKELLVKRFSYLPTVSVSSCSWTTMCSSRSFSELKSAFLVMASLNFCSSLRMAISGLSTGGGPGTGCDGWTSRPSWLSGWLQLSVEEVNVELESSSSFSMFVLLSTVSVPFGGSDKKKSNGFFTIFWRSCVKNFPNRYITEHCARRLHWRTDCVLLVSI